MSYRKKATKPKSKQQKLYFSDCFDLPNEGLRAYFEHVVAGQDDEYRTPFYKGKSLSEILANWNTELLSIKSKWPTLYQFEMDLASKVGPMSIMKPLSERMKDIDAYYDLISLDQIPVSDEAIQATIAEFKRASGIRLRSEETTTNLMKKSTNSGSPYFTKRRRVVDKTLPCTVGDNYQILGPNDNKFGSCAVLGWRGQEGGPSPLDVKQRVVWMFPFAVNIKELQCYQPLIEVFQHFNFVPAWVSMDAVDQRITNLFDTKGADDLIIVTDFSKFDQHFNAVCQEGAKTILKALLANDPLSEDWLENVFPIKYQIPLAYDFGKLREGKHGMGSGSGGTNADETLLHRALQHEAALNHGAVLNPNSQCLGDDGILSYPGCTVEDVIRTYTSHGQEMNPDKQYVSTQDCTYLRRWHHTDYRVDGVCVGVYSTMRALGRLAEQERFYDPDVWGPKMVALRQLSILENCKFHPLKEQFVDYCMKGDKYRLGIDIPGFLDNVDREAQKAIDYMPDFLGYTKSLQNEGHDRKVTGISEWWIVKYLKSKR